MSSGDFDERNGQNIFEMCVANGGPGFWIRRTTWGDTCACVVRVGAMTKPGPYFGNPSVLMDVYNLEGVLKEGLAPVPVPGTYKTWQRIPPPLWAGRTAMRQLDDPAIEQALQALDRRRDKATHANLQSEADDGRERVWLSVPFSRKDEAKRIGARWAPVEKRWWLSADDNDALSKAQTLGFL
ncbi:DUF5710 domain-containing protein [Inquilinus sp. OTU3971]|uniref:DUF5710 domain-containing protein n=1 Tax=Inquilinus sp. OTU3971 TaxID=3043855 RepID=UPI00313A8C7B